MLHDHILRLKLRLEGLLNSCNVVFIANKGKGNENCY